MNKERKQGFETQPDRATAVQQNTQIDKTEWNQENTVSKLRAETNGKVQQVQNITSECLKEK